MVMEKPDNKAVLFLLKEAGAVRSRKKLQKLVYLLQAGEAIPIGFEYEMYHYGPYSRQLDYKLKMLDLLGEVAVESDINDVPTYRLADSVGSIEVDPKVDDGVHRVLEKFGKRSPVDLELLTSIHYVAASEGEALEDDRLYQLLIAWKGGKFQRRSFDGALQELRDLNYL